MKPGNRNIIRVIKLRDAGRSAPTVDDQRGAVLEIEKTVRSWVHEMRTNQSIESRIVFSKFFGKTTPG